jgi:capsular polysaccharide biosynthesis protein
LAPVDDPAHRGDVPSIDLAGHFRELGRALLPALLIALVVGGVVFGLRTLLVPKQYAASIVTQITPEQTLIPGDAFIEQMRAPFMGLAQDTDVLNQVLSTVDTGWSAETLRDHVELAPGPAPQLLVFTVTADKPELAQQLARSMVVTIAQASFANHARDVGRQVDQVQASITAEQTRNATLAPDDPVKADSDKQLTDLRAQLASLQNVSGDQLAILSTPEQNPEPVSPQPVSEALVAALATLIVAAEAIVLLRSRVGSKPSRSWARRVALKYRSRFDTDTTDDGLLSPVAAATLAQNQRDGRAVAILLGDKAIAPKPVVPQDSRGTVPRPVLRPMPLGDEWWQTVDLGRVTAAVVIVSVAGSDRKTAERALRRLAEIGVPTFLVLQSSRRTRRAKAPEAAPPEPQSTPNGHAPVHARDHAD